MCFLPLSICDCITRFTSRAEKILPQGSKNAPGVHLLTNVEFLRGKTKVFESSAVELWELNVRDRKAGVFQLDLPLNI